MKRNEQIEFVSPAEFIPILEESGLIIPTGRWILRQAVACCKKWQEFIPEFKVNVNLSYVQIIKSRILDEIKQALKDYNLKPALLGIEVTESGYLENTYHYKKLWSSLKEEGITLVLDDYGTLEVGKNADLVCLKENPLDAISNVRKIDKVIKDGAVVVKK